MGKVQLALLQKFGDQKIITAKDINDFYGYHAKETIDSLIKQGILTRIKKGVFYIHDFGESGISIGPLFFVDLIGDGSGVISHGAALTHYDLLEQFFNETIVSVSKRPPRHKISLAGFDYTLTKSAVGHDFGLKKIMVRNKLIAITDIERTLLDAFSNPGLSGGIKGVAKAFYEAHNEGLIHFDKLLDYLDKYPNKIKLSRILGFFIDSFSMKVPDSFYASIFKASGGNYIWLESATDYKIKGNYHKKWRLIIDANENYQSVIQY